MVLLSDLGGMEMKCSGLIASITTCGQCYSDSDVEEQPFSCLSIEVPAEAERNRVSLASCISKSFGDEVMKDDNYNCPSCKQ